MLVLVPALPAWGPTASWLAHPGSSHVWLVPDTHMMEVASSRRWRRQLAGEQAKALHHMSKWAMWMCRRR